MGIRAAPFERRSNAIVLMARTGSTIMKFLCVITLVAGFTRHRFAGSGLLVVPLHPDSRASSLRPGKDGFVAAKVKGALGSVRALPRAHPGSSMTQIDCGLT